MPKVENKERPIIWLIDENKRELRTHFNILKRIIPKVIEVIPLEAYKNLDDYLPLLEDSRTACIITDQQLKVSGVATYTGIELAEFLRSINSKIPIYILTNFADDKDAFIGGEWTIEEIIRKSELGNEEEQKILVARLLRRMNIYEDIQDERDKRLNSLLMKSMNGELVNAELEELDALKLQKTSASLAKELTQIRQMEQIVQAHDDLMSKIDHFLQGRKGDDQNVV